MSFDFAGFVDPHDVRMADAGDVFDLTLEACRRIEVRRVAAGKKLQGDGTLQVGLPGAVDACLTATGKLVLDQESSDLLPQFGQGLDVKS